MAWKVFDIIIDGIIEIKSKVINVDNFGYLTFDGKRIAIQETVMEKQSQL